MILRFAPMPASAHLRVPAGTEQHRLTCYAKLQILCVQSSVRISRDASFGWPTCHAPGPRKAVPHGLELGRWFIQRRGPPRLHLHATPPNAARGGGGSAAACRSLMARGHHSPSLWVHALGTACGACGACVEACAMHALYSVGNLLGIPVAVWSFVGHGGAALRSAAS